jgi:hypothetical protein
LPLSFCLTSLAFSCLVPIPLSPIPLSHSSVIRCGTSRDRPPFAGPKAGAHGFPPCAGRTQGHAPGRAERSRREELGRGGYHGPPRAKAAARGREASGEGGWPEAPRPAQPRMGRRSKAHGDALRAVGARGHSTRPLFAQSPAPAGGDGTIMADPASAVTDAAPWSSGSAARYGAADRELMKGPPP